MCQAAAEGVIDFTRADPRDPRWWIQLRLVLDRLEDRNVMAITRLNHATAAALISRADLDESAVNKVNDHAETLVLQVKQTLFPWVTFDKRTQVRQALDAMSAQWVRDFGDPNDPATMARIDATVAMMARQLEESRRNTHGG